jgi:hypothetical protein
MLRRLALLLALLALPCVAQAQGQNGAFIQYWPPAITGGIWSSNLELRDPSQLAAESLTNGVLTAGASWTQTADFALAANAATYTHATGAGSFQQTSAAGAVPWASAGINGWYTFTYTVSAVTGAPVCTIPSTFALAAETLTSADGSYSLTFKAMATTVGDFKVSCTSGAAATITFDTLSLKRITGGNLTVRGQILAGDGTGALPGYGFARAPGTGFSLSNTLNLSLSGNTWYTWASSSYSNAVTDTADLGFAAIQWKSVFVARSTQGCKRMALTAGAATTFATVAVPQTALVNFASGEVIWNVRASDATDIQTLAGHTGFNCVNKAGTETCAAIVTDTATAVAASAGAAADDLACTMTAVTGLTDVIGLAANCTTAEMTETSLEICYRFDMPQANTLVPGT